MPIAKKSTMANIMAWFNNEKGRLVLDFVNSVVYFGKPKLLSTDVPPTSIQFSIPLEDVESAHLFDDGSLIMKKYYLQIRIRRNLLDTYDEWIENGVLSEDGALIIWTSRRDGETFSWAYNRFLSDVKTEVQEDEDIAKNIEVNILSPFKASTRVDLVEFTEANRDRIREYISRPDDDDLSQALLDTDELELLKVIVRSLISHNKLNGVIDEKTNEYIDRDFIEKTQKIVNVNVELNFDALLKQLGNKGINLTAFQCPQCHANCTVPPSGTSFQCQSCDAVIKITDIFEKFKHFLI